MRLFSISLWHHFAYMIISLALLGYGASGALLTLAQRAMQRQPRRETEPAARHDPQALADGQRA